MFDESLLGSALRYPCDMGGDVDVFFDQATARRVIAALTDALDDADH